MLAYKNFGVVAATAAAAVLPGVVATLPPAPLLTTALSSVTATLVAGAVPALLGGAILLGGRVKAAVIVTLALGAFVSFTLLYPMLRGY